ncbi:MAG: hypothetical protein H5T74_12350 [Actinobacteria bacterium]|nr:hypothetical protein [Actinomycetota bacterium]
MPVFRGGLNGLTMVTQKGYGLHCYRVYNSFYAATEIGPDGAIYHGTLYGINRMQP